MMSGRHGFALPVVWLLALAAGPVAASAVPAPEWPQAPKAPAGAPSIVVILLDDIGFADTSTFGGIAQTPALDRLAARGLRYINFNNAGMCSPTRAALLSGRNHHRVGFGVAESSGGYPGYNFVWKESTASVAEVLRRNGYSTAAFGKWHNTPHWEITPVGPFDRWPTGLGFEYFYGLMNGEDNQWEPASLFRNTTPVSAPKTPREGYHLTRDITDVAIAWVRTHESLAPEKPFFMYFATGAVHAPHHVPREWIEQYRGRFDRGWDELRAEVFARQKELGVVPDDAKLTPRPAEIPAWSSLSSDQKKLYARQMEVYAGFVAHTDHEIGRLLEVVRELPGGDNTLVMYIVGDNGSAPGGAHGVANGSQEVAPQLQHLDELGSAAIGRNSYAGGWAWLGSTPFQGWKTIASHFGGVRSPFIVSWPARIKASGEVRTQFTHVNGVAGTVYEVVGVHLPDRIDGVRQQPLDSSSFAQTFDDARAPAHQRLQYFEMLGNRAMYEDGWVAAARNPKPGGTDFRNARWELYRVEDDFTESEDLASRYPARLERLRKRFEAEARKNDVYPLMATLDADRPSLVKGRSEFTFYPGLPRLNWNAMPPLAGRSYRITADAVIPAEGAEGVILSYGGRESGFVLYLKNDRLVLENRTADGPNQVLVSDATVPRGRATLSFEFIKTGTGPGVFRLKETTFGRGSLSINGRVVAEGDLTDTVGGAYSVAMGVGRGFGSSISEAFIFPFAFTGELERVTVKLL